MNKSCDIDTKVSGLENTPVQFVKVSVTRPCIKILVLVSR